MPDRRVFEKVAWRQMYAWHVGGRAKKAKPESARDMGEEEGRDHVVPLRPW